MKAAAAVPELNMLTLSEKFMVCELSGDCCLPSTGSCKNIPACLNFRGIVAVSHRLSAVARQSSIFGKIGGNYSNLSGICVHHSVQVSSKV